jgi:1,4-alpha-glucan branching enzyme
VWAVELQDNADGSPAVPHDSKVKIRLKHWDGWTIDLVPAWTKFAVMPGGMGSTFDGVHWDPPASERHQWCDTDLLNRNDSLCAALCAPSVS